MLEEGCSVLKGCFSIPGILIRGSFLLQSSSSSASSEVASPKKKIFDADDMWRSMYLYWFTSTRVSECQFRAMWFWTRYLGVSRQVFSPQFPSPFPSPSLCPGFDSTDIPTGMVESLHHKVEFLVSEAERYFLTGKGDSYFSACGHSLP